MNFKGTRYCPRCQSENLKLIDVDFYSMDGDEYTYPTEFECEDCKTSFLIYELEDIRVKQ